MRKPPNPGAFVLLHGEGRWAGLAEGRGAGAVGGWFGVLIRFSGCDLGFGAGRWGGVYVGCGWDCWCSAVFGGLWVVVLGWGRLPPGPIRFSMCDLGFGPVMGGCCGVGCRVFCLGFGDIPRV